MREINSFEEAIFLLKSNTTIVQFSNGMTVYFALKDERIKVFGKNANYTLDEDTFKSLFKNEKFYEVEPKLKEDQISILKDEEYYNWKHK